MKGHESSQGNTFLSVVEAASYLGISRRLLDNWRYQGGGPKYRKHGGRVLYLRDDLDQWSKDREYSSTGG